MFGFFKRNIDIFNGSSLPDRAFNELQIKTAAHVGIWHLDVADWSLNQDDGNISFIAQDHNIQVTAPAQILGSFNTDDSTWLWAHLNSSVDENLSRHSYELYTFCINSKFKVSDKMKINENIAWKLAALSCMNNNSQGIYRGPVGNTMVFIEFGLITMSKIS